MGSAIIQDVNRMGLRRQTGRPEKSENLLKRDFKSEKTLVKYVTDITEIKARDGKLYSRF